MKKLFLLLIVLAIGFGCSKDKDDNNNNNNSALTARLVGNWEMTDLFYDASIPNPLDPFNPIDLTGPADNVFGDFNIVASPNSVNYDYGFDIENPLGVGQGFPISQAGQGTWSVLSSDTKVVFDQNGETTIYDVEVNEADLQVWSSTIPTTVPGLGITVNADIRITLIRK